MRHYKAQLKKRSAHFALDLELKDRLRRGSAERTQGGVRALSRHRLLERKVIGLHMYTA